MSEWFTYLLQSSVTLSLLYLVYALVLRRDTFFALNRFYLGGSLVFSVVFPLFRFGDLASVSNPEYSHLLETITITPSTVSGAISGNPGLFQLLFMAYLTGSGDPHVPFCCNAGSAPSAG